MPAWWAVGAPAPPSGEAGATDADHTGSLFQVGVVADGLVYVEADDHIQAAGVALSGSVHVTLDNQSVVYGFGPETVGLPGVRRPFAVGDWADGGPVELRLEDLAYLPDVEPDWDYDDRTWTVTIAQAEGPLSDPEFVPTGNQLPEYVPPADDPQNPHDPSASEPVLDTGLFTWDNDYGELAQVVYRLTLTAEDKYRWTYRVTNISVPSAGTFTDRDGLYSFALDSQYLDVTLATDFTASVPWTRTGPLTWEDDVTYADQYAIPINGTATFAFQTPPHKPSPGFGYADSGPEVDAVDGGVTVPARVSVSITDSAGVSIGANGLKVAKWENAFEFWGGGAHVKGVDTKTGYDIIDLDPDRFNVWVYDLQEWDAKTAHIEVVISTLNVAGFGAYNDSPTAVDLVRYTGQEYGPGWYWSDSQMLVSNKVDDIASVPGVGADDTGPGAVGTPKDKGYRWRTSDRTHRVALRGTVVAEYVFLAGAPGVKDDRPVPVRHTVNAHVNILNAPGGNTGVITVQQANDDFVRANEQYAQVGVLLVPSFSPNVAWPAGVDLTNGLDEFTGLVAGKINLTTEEESLLVPGLRTAGLDDIEVYYVNYLNTGNTNQGSRGEAIPASMSPAPRYEDSAIISAVDRAVSPFTLAHELGHVLLNDGSHYAGAIPEVNLMRSGTSNTDGLEESKRLNSTQDSGINTRRPNLLK